MRPPPRPAAIGLALALFAMLQCLPAVLNGYPFVFYDSRGYYNAGSAAVGFAARRLDRGAPAEPAAPVDAGGAATAATAVDGVADGAADGVADGAADATELSFARSPYYGVPLYLLFGLSPFAVALVQALIVAGLAWIAARLVVPDRPLRAYLAAGLVCAAATPLPYFAGYLMPDVFAAAVPLGIGLLAWGWPRLGWGARLFLWVALAGALLVHTSHILLAAGLVVVVAALAAIRPLRPSGAGTLAAASACAAGLAGVVLFTLAIRAVFGVDPANPPYLTARGLEDGPVAEMIAAGCPGVDFAVCAADPVANADSQVFLWDTAQGFYGAGDAALRARLSREDFAVFLTAAARAPGRQVGAALRNTARQFAMFGLYEFATAADVHATSAPNYLPPAALDRLGASRAAQGAVPFGVLSVLVYAGAVAGALLLAALAFAGRLGRLGAALVVVTIATLVGNAIAGGALSDAHHRYQARLIWLVPFLATLLLFAARPGKVAERRGE